MRIQNRGLLVVVLAYYEVWVIKDDHDNLYMHLTLHLTYKRGLKTLVLIFLMKIDELEQHRGIKLVFQFRELVGQMES
jgi:hypothetical protein